MNKWILALLAFVFSADVALAQEVAAEAAACTSFMCEAMKNFPEINAWLIVIFTSLGLILRGVSELLVFVGSKIQNKASSEWGARLGSYAVWAAQVVGWFGGGTPKAIIQKKVDNELGKQGSGSVEGSNGEQPK